jgi:hypothetical protein
VKSEVGRVKPLLPLPLFARIGLSRVVCRSDAGRECSACLCFCSGALVLRMRGTRVRREIGEFPVPSSLSTLPCRIDPVKPHGPLVRLGYTCCHASTCRLSTWWSPTALQRPCGLGGFILGRASHLDAFSGSPVPAWLPGAAFGNTTGTPEASPSRSSRTRDGFPQSSNAHDGYRPNCLTTF